MPQALAEDRRLVEAAPDRADGGEASDRLSHRRRPPWAAPAWTARSTRSVSNASTQPAVRRPTRHQLVVRAVVDHVAALEVHDVVGEGDRRRARGHHQHGGAGERAAQVAEHGPLGGRVERRRGVVEQQQRRLAHERPGQGDPLALSAAEAHPALADHRVEAGRAGRRRSVRPAPGAAPPTPRRRRAPAPSTTLSRIVPPNRNASWNTIARAPAVVATAPCVGTDQPAGQLDERALAGTRGPDDGHDAPRRHLAGRRRAARRGRRRGT